jgi:hypothetical protein
MRAAPWLCSLAVVSLTLTGCNTDDPNDPHSAHGGMPASAGSAGAPLSGGGQAPSAGGSSGAGAGAGGSGGSDNRGGTSGQANGGAPAAVGGSAGSGSGSGGNGAAGTGAGGSGGAGTGGVAGATNNGGSGAGTGPCATALFCDDFESYDAMPNGKWQANTASGSVAIDGTEHVSGTKSVRLATTSAGSATAMLRISDASIFPVPNNVLYGRMLFKLVAAPITSVHWTIVEGLGVVPGQTYRAEYRYGGQMPVTQGELFLGSQMMANYDTPDWYSNKSTPGSDCWHHADKRVIPVGTWTCVEWMFDGPNNTMKLWLDNQPADDLTVVGHGDGCVNAANDFAWTAPNFSELDLGWESYQQDDARMVYIDDVALGTSKLGCP